MKINGKNIENFLMDKNIIKIYSCRCGCGGNYFYKGDNGFDEYLKIAFNRCNSMRESSKRVQDNFFMEEPKGQEEGYINIPMPKNQCYCIYFK